MRSHHLSYFTLILAILIPFKTALSTQISDLSEAELKRLEKGEIVMFQEDLKDLPWPKVTAFLEIEASPLEAMAVFAAYDIQKDYVPKLVKSKPFKAPEATKVFVEYEMDLPWPLPNNKYIHGHELLSQKGEDNHYRLKWWMEESNSAKDVQGEAAFFEKEKQTYLRYQSLIVPNSKLAGLISGSMLKDVKNTLKAIKETTQDYTKNRADLVQIYSKLITESLEGKPVWKQKIDSSRSQNLRESNKEH